MKKGYAVFCQDFFGLNKEICRDLERELNEVEWERILAHLGNRSGTRQGRLPNVNEYIDPNPSRPHRMGVLPGTTLSYMCYGNVEHLEKALDVEISTSLGLLGDNTEQL